MMKILIISDSHGLEEELLQINKLYEKDVQLMVHCGDSELPYDHSALNGFKVVKGNCDFDPMFPNQVVHEVNGLRLFATHGHLYNVKMSLMNLMYRAEEVGASIICFGHSHLAGSELIDGKVFINPGSILLPRGRKEPTYCTLEVYNNMVNVIFYNQEHTKLNDLCHTYTL
jgi:putative phosphoesterase